MFRTLWLLALLLTQSAFAATWCPALWQALMRPEPVPSAIPPVTRVTVSAIAAVSENGIIGNGTAMPWHIPEDLKFFRERTQGHAVLMGRKTFESLGSKPLPGRLNIVITRQADFKAPPGVWVVPSIEQAIQLAKGETDKWGNEIFVVGGGEIYKQALPLTDRVYLTRVHREAEGVTPFPVLAANEFKEIQRRPGGGDFTFHTFERR